MKGSITARLRSQGWERDDAPVEEIGECTDPSGCSRAGRWHHRFVDGSYCAQHAAQGDDQDLRWDNNKRGA